MQKPQPNYKFYATLLEAFLWYKVSESENAEQEFIDKINRVPVTDESSIERMSKGTALNNVVDRYVYNNGVMLCGHYSDKVNDLEFTFDEDLIKKLGDKLIGSIPQIYTETILKCNGYNVLVYGYIDYIISNKLIDLKSTKTYDLGKYKDSLQMHLYPVSCYKEHDVKVDEFEFLVTDLKEVFTETYKVNLIESERIITNVCNDLINFIEAKKHSITDKKIFGLE